MSEIIVSLQHVNKSFGSNHVIKNLDLEIKKGEFLTLLGPSGCGKTTILRLIAGFETATSGTILVEGEHVEEKEPFQRDVNTVFQNYALFPHMTVYDNVAYGLTVKKVPKAEIRERVTEMLQLVQLPGFENRKPDMMSGGQKQRVAIARALINRPKVLLLDEPLGALDLKLRKQMQIELKRLQKKLNITFVYVTHDQEEALTMSDRIAVMNAGILDQLDAPDRIYKKPKTKFVAGFIGESNLFEGTVEAVDGNTVKASGRDGTAVVEASGFAKGQPIYISVRPEDTKMSKEPIAGFSLKGVLKDVIFIGSHLSTHITLESGNEVKINRARNEGVAQEGDTVYVHWDKEDAVGISELGGGASALTGGEADE